jgi:hypothetical protein
MNYTRFWNYFILKTYFYINIIILSNYWTEAAISEESRVYLA